MNLVRSRRYVPAGREPQRGQGLVEFAMLVPVFMLILLGLLEFGFVFDHTMTISYATREGARSGAAFASGNGGTMPCNEVDQNIIAAVQRVVDSPGSQVDPARISEIRIYKAQADGTQSGGSVNRWVPGAGPSVDGQALSFTPSVSNWDACTRVNSWVGTTPPDSLGVSIQYSYQFVTPLSAVLGFFGPPGGASLAISDRTVMALNPVN